MSDQRRPVNHITTDIPPVDLSIDLPAFDRAIRSQGVRLVHYKAIRCPVGMTDIGDNRRPHPDHSGCSGGFLFHRAGTVTALFIGNSKHKTPTEVGFYDGSTAQVTFPTHYDDSEESVIVAPFDRFYLEEEGIVVPMWQLFLHHESGQDRFKYPVIRVEHLVDSRGEKYQQDQDFVVEEGQIRWLGTRAPVSEIDLGPGAGNGFGTDRGSVCSIRYLYRPFWYCGQVLHEVRVAQIQDPITGTRTLRKMPQSVMLHREYVALNQQQDLEQVSGSTPPDSDFLRQVLGSMNGGFGPR